MQRVYINVRLKVWGFFLLTLLLLLQVNTNTQCTGLSPHISLTCSSMVYSTSTVSSHFPLLFQQLQDHHFFACFIQLQETPAIKYEHSECSYRITGKVVVNNRVNSIYTLFLSVCCWTTLILKIPLSTLLEEHKTAIHIFNLFKLNVVKIFSLNNP